MIIRWTIVGGIEITITAHSIYFNTRMHSSRMRTGRTLTVCHSLLLMEGGAWI